MVYSNTKNYIIILYYKNPEQGKIKREKEARDSLSDQVVVRKQECQHPVEKVSLKGAM